MPATSSAWTEYFLPPFHPCANGMKKFYVRLPFPTYLPVAGSECVIQQAAIRDNEVI